MAKSNKEKAIEDITPIEETPNEPKVKIFDLSEIGFEDLNGDFVKINFDQKEIANFLYINRSSIEMSAFAKALHADGKAPIDDLIKAELIEQITGRYKFSAVEAIKEYIEKL